MNNKENKMTDKQLTGMLDELDVHIDKMTDKQLTGMLDELDVHIDMYIDKTKGKKMKQEFKEDDYITVPKFDDLINYFGENSDGLPKMKKIAFAERMIDMCGKEYKISHVSRDGISLEDDKEVVWLFDKSMWQMDKVEETKTHAPYVGIKRVKYINETILKQMAHRYDFVKHEKLRREVKKHGIIDSCYPYEKGYQEMFGGLGIPKTKEGTYAISERIAKEMQVPQLQVTDLITILGYNKTEIKTMMLAMKKKRHKLVVIGYGGTGTNFLHWFSQLALLTNTKHHFKDLVLSDNDYFDSVNLLRIPFILPEINGNKLLKKVKYFADYATITESFYATTINVGPGNMYFDYIHYGAPDLETRQLLKDELVPFVAATHRNEDCALTLRPDLDTELMVETYGKISLTTFFLNHLKMTIEFIKFLADEKTTYEVLTGPQLDILKYNFVTENQDFITNGKTINGKKLYPVIASDDNRVRI